jgi:small-conductance mechanosensitive channel
MNKKTLLTDFDFWRYLINAWSIIFFAAIIYDARTGNGAEGVLKVISIIYIGVLAIYVSNKEFERWYHHHRRQHPGEVFVVVWSALVAVLLAVDIVTRSAYHLPETVVSSYIAVLTILAITRKSRQVYRSRYLKD